MIIISVLTMVCSFDFWFTKNIAGRLMVGLFWQRQIHEDGEENFQYECNANEENNNRFDTFVFWWSQYIAVLVWLFIFVLNIMAFSFNVY